MDGQVSFQVFSGENNEGNDQWYAGAFFSILKYAINLYCDYESLYKISRRRNHQKSRREYGNNNLQELYYARC